MNAQAITQDLEKLLSSSDVQQEMWELTEAWISRDVGIEAVEPVLTFIEANPHIDFGSPGPFVHFVERFYRDGYEALLIASINRCPTTQTVWMLNRLINSASDETEAETLKGVLRQAQNHQKAGPEVRKEIADFLQFQNQV